jgi:vitamin B12 transporter
MTAVGAAKSGDARPGARLAGSSCERRGVLFVVFLLAAAGILRAQEGAEAGEERERITVVGEALPTDPRSVSSQVTVITGEEIRASAKDSVAEVVASVTGVQINRYGGATEPSLVSIRGSSPEQVLVLINGKRLNSAQGGGVDLGSISTEDIERIEVVRGGSGALHGHNALGGVINIVTKDGYGKDFEHSVSYGFSSYFTHELSWQLLGPLGADRSGDFFIGLKGLSTEGGYIYSDPHGGGSAVRLNTAGLMGDGSVKLGWTVDPLRGIRLALTSQFHASRKGVPGLAEFPTPEAEMEDLRALGLVSFTYHNNPVASLSLDAHVLRQTRRYTDPGYFLGAVNDSHDNTAFGAEAELSRNDDFKYVFVKSTAGYDFRFDRLLSSGLVTTGGADASGTVERAAHGVFFREEIHILPFGDTGYGRLQLTPALRYDGAAVSYPDDAYSSVRGRMSWGLGLLVPFGPERRVVLKGNIGTGYRVPSFDDLFWPSTAFAVGNPSLEPEEAMIYDVGVLARPFPFLSVEGVFYHHGVHNLIQWMPGPSGQWRPRNIGAASMTGAEAEVRMLFRLDRIESYLEAAGNYTFLSALDVTESSVTTGKQLPRRARHRGNFSLTWKHDRGHSVYLGGRYVSRRYQTAANTKYLPGYFVLDTAGRLRLGKYITFVLTVDNILNLEYIDIREFPIPDREIGCSIRFSY